MGFNRFGIPYWFTDEEIDFVLKAIEFVAQYGWMFLPNYTFDVHKGEWLSRYFKEHKHRIWLGSIDYGNGNFDSEHLQALREEKSFHQHEVTKPDYQKILEDAKKHLVDTVSQYNSLLGKTVVD